jgi:hypothetical protein
VVRLGLGTVLVLLVPLSRIPWRTSFLAGAELTSQVTYVPVPSGEVVLVALAPPGGLNEIPAAAADDDFYTVLHFSVCVCLVWRGAS